MFNAAVTVRVSLTQQEMAFALNCDQVDHHYMALSVSYMEKSLQSQKDIGLHIRSVRHLSKKFIAQSSRWCEAAKVTDFVPTSSL